MAHTSMARSNVALLEDALAGDHVLSAIAKAYGLAGRGEIDAGALFQKWRPQSRRSVDELTTKNAVAGVDMGNSSALLRQGAVAYYERLLARTSLQAIDAHRVAPLVRLNATGSTPEAFFVPEGGHVPLSRWTLSAPFVLTPSLVAAIVVHSRELARTTNPLAAATLQRGQSDGILQTIERTVWDGEAAIERGRSAGLLYGTTGFDAGSPADLEVAIGEMVAAVRPVTPHFVASVSGVIYLAKARSASGARLFPDVDTVDGGRLWGVPLSLSVGAEDRLILADSAAIYYATDDTGTEFESVSAAALKFDDAPPDGAGAVVSLLQTGSVAVMARQYLAWRKAAADSVAWTSLPIGSPVV